MIELNSDKVPKFRFEMAISFHRTDEGLATEISDVLQKRFRTSIYYKHQEMLAGRDGEEKFGGTFRDARVVIVLCRQEWGQTPFTRIEKTAI